MKSLNIINENYNYEMWKQIKIYAFSIESCNIARMFFGTGIEVDSGVADEEVSTEIYLGDEIDVKPILDQFKPKNSKIKFGDFFSSLSPKANSNLYSLISENLLVDLVSIFEAYLQSIIEHLLIENQHLVLTKEKQISAFDLIKITDIEELKTKLIEEKVRKLMYQNIQTIISYIKKGYKVDLKINEDQIKDIYYWKEIRNLIIHNRSIVNDVFLQSLKKNEIRSELKIGDRLKIEIVDVVQFALNIRFIGNELYTKITGAMPIELEEDPFKNDVANIIDSYYKKGSVKKEKQIGRNALCFCGSGKKYKNCCMKLS